MLSPAEFAVLTGANADFSPAHLDEWMLFWKTDICEKDEFHTSFPHLSLSEAQRVWITMEEHFFSVYDNFLRVWPEWGSSGISAPPYPGSRVTGGMVDYCDLSLSAGVIERFKAWQAEFDGMRPGESVADPKGFTNRAEELARDLKPHVGPRTYVEFYELIEVLKDGTTRACRPLLGLHESAPERANLDIVESSERSRVPALAGLSCLCTGRCGCRLLCDHGRRMLGLGSWLGLQFMHYPRRASAM